MKFINLTRLTPNIYFTGNSPLQDGLRSLDEAHEPEDPIEKLIRQSNQPERKVMVPEGVDVEEEFIRTTLYLEEEYVKTCLESVSQHPLLQKDGTLLTFSNNSFLVAESMENIMGIFHALKE